MSLLFEVEKCRLPCDFVGIRKGLRLGRKFVWPQPVPLKVLAKDVYVLVVVVVEAVFV